MSYSNTYNFQLDNSDIVTEAFERCGLEPDAINGVQLRSCLRSLNLALIKISNLQPLLYNKRSYVITLVPGQESYTLDPTVISIADCYLNNTTGIDRIIMAIARDEYAAIPNKSSQAIPTSYYLDRQIVPVMYLWGTGNNPTQTITLNVWQQNMDAGSALNNLNLPQRAFDWVCAELAARVAEKWMPERLQEKVMIAAQCWQQFSDENSEKVNYTFQPGWQNSGYNRP